MSGTPLLTDLLNLERLEHNLFRGQSHKTGAPQVFGGQVLGQALMAATQTVENYHVHSLHSYFLRGGDMNTPIIYDVDRIRDGRSFCTRRVVAIQHGRPIFNMSASFQLDEQGLEHQSEMPKSPAPSTLQEEASFRKQFADKNQHKHDPFIHPDWPFDIRRCDQLPHEINPAPRSHQHQVWFRLKESIQHVPDIIHKCILAYSSDLNLLSSATRPHGISYLQPDVRLATIDHAMWFHRPFDASEWLLYEMESPSASGGRGFCRGNIFNQQGDLVASCTQEGLMRKGKK
ncbi:MAG: acyl-CoA thioesterase II [Gammaproteobacteria bacterium]|nr:MAG: acyl-CoA thioesterase II [Gammaproteobacteria bacterium]